VIGIYKPLGVVNLESLFDRVIKMEKAGGIREDIRKKET